MIRLWCRCPHSSRNSRAAQHSCSGCPISLLAHSQHAACPMCSNGSPDELRDILNQVYLCILKKCGITSAILDGFDDVIVNIAHDKTTDLENLVGRIVDGEEVDTTGLDKKELDYVKTAKLLLGHSLYSHSWLEL